MHFENAAVTNRALKAGELAATAERAKDLKEFGYGAIRTLEELRGAGGRSFMGLPTKV